MKNKILIKKIISIFSVVGVLFFYQNCSNFESKINSSSSKLDVVTFDKVNQAVFSANCVHCHNDKESSGGVNLSSYQALINSNIIVPYSSGSSTLYISLINGSMPPGGSLPKQSLDLIAKWIDDGALESGDVSSCKKPSVLLPRLSHFEYKTIIRDITSSTDVLSEVDNLPTLPPRYGFDNISNTLIDRVTADAYITLAEPISQKILSATSVQSQCDTMITLGEHTWNNCALPIVRYVGQRLYRRPLRMDEITKQMELFNTSISSAQAVFAPNTPSVVSIYSKDFYEGISAVIISQLISPNFLFKMEYFPGGFSPDEKQYLIASKLSLALTASYPDAELWAKAQSGKLNNESIIKQQVDRLLSNYKDRFSANFAGQWLGYKSNLNKSPANLDGALARESYFVFQEVLNNNELVSNLLTPGYTFVNQLLADHMNLSASTNMSQFVKVNTNERGGILSQGHFLKKTSSLDKTNPVKRGIWVLDTVLCRTLPPLDAATFEEIAEAQSSIDPNAPLVERMELHRETSKRCYTCHSQIDPIGLALENWDHVGQFRTSYLDGKPVVADLMFNGTLVSNSYQLAESIEKTREFRNCVKKKLESYFIGMSPIKDPQCATQVPEDTPLRQMTSDTIVNFLKESL